MREIISTISIVILLSSCQKEISTANPNHEDWKKRTVKEKINDSLYFGQTYLSVYSQIYIQSEHRTHDLTATISIRNASVSDSIYILKANYFDTKGKLIRKYFETPIFLSPLETVEIIINEADIEGGTGANFIFDWKIKKNSTEPIFEGVMISTSGQQGLSFTTSGKRIK